MSSDYRTSAFDRTTVVPTDCDSREMVFDRERCQEQYLHCFDCCKHCFNAHDLKHTFQTTAAAACTITCIAPIVHCSNCLFVYL